MKRASFIALMVSGLVTQAFADSKDIVDKPRKPQVEIALLLDTSSSMSGLINQAKNELWKVVNEFALSEQNGIKPDLKVSLYEYGKSSLQKKDGYIRQIIPLSDDLDKISEELFALTTNGGDEYCGMVIKHAVTNLKWSDNNNDLKMIFTFI